MKRRKFLVTTALAAVGSSFVFARNHINWFEFDNIETAGLAKVSDKLEAEFGQLIRWLKDNGWTAYITEVLGVNFNYEGNELKAELTKELDKDKLGALQVKEKSGYDDCAGTCLIKPGFPAFSLLYHTLASPRVKPPGVKEYPRAVQIDLLENYIYALADFDKLKSTYNIGRNEELVFAVFAYEYRPAFKTPHYEHADLVFSRTGVARIGDEPVNYDSENRCYVNRPLNPGKVKHIAVTPSRYGLFLAKKGTHNEVDLMTTGIFKQKDPNNDSNDRENIFLQPVRKIFDNDLLTMESPVKYYEAHKNEKLRKLAISKNFKIKDGLVPVAKESKDLVIQDDSVRVTGSSFLVISKPGSLIRPAKVGDANLYFYVDKLARNNRYFTAYSTQEVEDIELLDGHNRVPNRYDQPRNQAMFVNITHQYTDTAAYRQMQRNSTDAFEKSVRRGGYYAPLFEGNICDGKVDVNMSSFDLKNLQGVTKTCLPAFSIVTAPDFFPQVDPFDLAGFDVAPGSGENSNFYEGGVASLATARIRPNPKVIDASGDPARKTYTAVLSGKHQAGNGTSKSTNFKNPAVERGYYISGFLPDVSSSVFAPGWDVTYCKDDTLSNEIYIGTEGLGSPFIEDMKFCSALNGMWPATSPDTARTYQGSHETEYRNPTAVPLLDDEIGIHKDSPCTDTSLSNSLGWDGEQGPFLEKNNGAWKVNFTDLGRADAVQNALDGIFDMSRLRNLTSAELLQRMACLKLCIESLPKKNFKSKKNEPQLVAYTYLWLVSAEKVNWSTADANAFGIPADLVGNNKDWIALKSNAKVSGEGYLYVFVESASDTERNKDWADHKRRRLACNNVYVCQVTNKNIAWKEVLHGTAEWEVK